MACIHISFSWYDNSFTRLGKLSLPKTPFVPFFDDLPRFEALEVIPNSNSAWFTHSKLPRDRLSYVADSSDGVSPSGGQQLHRTVPSQLQGRRGLDGGVSQRAGSARWYRTLDRRVQSRSASSRSRKSYPARGILEFCRCTKNRGPDCLN